MDILGGITGAVGAAPTKTTTSGTASGTTASTASGTGTTTRNLTPYQTALQGPIFDYIRKLMMPGGATAAVAPYAAQARDQTNSTYSGLADSLRQQFLSTGGGTSGKYGMALTSGNLARLGALQGVDTSAATTAASLPLTAANLAQQLLGMNFGETTTQQQSGNQTTQQQSNQTSTSQQGNMGLGALGGVASTLLSLM